MCDRKVKGMKRLDRLIIEAKERLGSEQLSLAILHADYNNEIYMSNCYIDGGEPANCRTIVNEHSSEVEAIDYIHQLSEEFPNSTDITIIINDLYVGV